jgi:phosphoglycolate phosphatase
MIKLVIFDLDGTLVDAYRAIIKSVNFTLKKMGYPSAFVFEIRRAVGWGDRHLIAAFVNEPDIERALVIYRKHHRWTLKRYSQLLPSAEAILKYLSSAGLCLAIASNRPTEFTHIILRRLKIEKYFDYILCADKLHQGKPHPGILLKIMKRLESAPEETLYVGDMAIDVRTAHNAKIKAIAVPTGSSSLSEIKKATPFKIIKNLAFLKKYL